MRIRPAETPQDIAAVRTLFRWYAAEADAPECFATFESELAALPGEYAPPEGLLLIATAGKQPAGCVALRRLADGSGEMKRLYVRAPYRRTGLGRELLARVVAAANARGHRRLLLDTLPSMQAAITLYRASGFREIDPYLASPTPGARCFELSLS